MKTWLPWSFALPHSTSFTLGAALMAVLALSAATSRANLLSNPSFESGDGTRVSNWAWFGNAWQATNHAYGGSFCLKLYGNWSGPGNASGVYQTLPARPGQRWTLSGYGLNASDDALAGQNYALMKIVWFSGPNGTGDQLQPLPGPGALTGATPGIESAQLTNGTPTDEWQFLSASGVAPPGTMSVQLLGGLFIQPGTDAGAAWFDDLKANATPVWGHALSFDGTNDYVVFNRPVSNDFTLECWFRSTQHAGLENDHWFWGMGLVDGAYPGYGVFSDFGLSLGGGKVLFGTGGTQYVTIRSGDVADGQWHHVAATREQASGTMNLYVDGALVASGTNGTQTLDAQPQLRLGAVGMLGGSVGNFFQGELDDIRIWNVVLSAEEIRQRMVYPLTGTETNLVAYWKFDEGSGTTASSTTNGYLASFIGPEWTPSTIPLWGNALSFDGADDYVVFPNFGNAVPTTEVTVEFWQRLTVTNRIHRVFGLLTDNSANRFMFEDRDDGSLLWDFGNIANGGRLWSPKSSTVTGAWQHIALVAKAGTPSYMEIYCNGVLRARTNRADAFAPYNSDLFMGYRPDVRLYGQVDEFRIWNKARTQAEIAADMLHPLTGAEPNLVAYWSFDGTSANAIRDATLNHHDGILTNGTTRVSSVISAPNLAVNPGFEQGTASWWPFGSAILTSLGFWPHSGTSCVFVFNRAESWQGLQQQFENVLQPGLIYLISGWMRLDSADSQPVSLTMLKKDSSGTSYDGVASGTAIYSAWTRLSGSYTPTVFGTLTNLWLYVSGPDAGVDFYADDFVVAPDMAYAPLPLAATTLPPRSMINNNATLNGTVQPGGLPTTAWFEWRTNLVYEHATAPIAVGTSWEELSVSNVLSGLTPGLIYHCRLVASNRLCVARGTDLMFWLPALLLNSPDPLTNECHAAFVDPISVNASPLAIAAGGEHSLALGADGSVVGWGNNSYGQTTIPPSATNGVVAIASGAYHSLALRADGSVVGWGNNSYDQTTIPDTATNNVVAIATGLVHSLALKADGSVVCWGYNYHGQATTPVGLTNAVAIAAGDFHSLALKGDGSVIGWGDISLGLANVPDSANNDVVAIAAGGSDFSGFSLALKADGSVVGWGDNSGGQTTIPDTAINGVVAIAAGVFHSLALKADGSVIGWGAGGPGSSGYPHYGQSTIPAAVSRLSLPISVSGTMDTDTPGSYALTYSVTNALGAVATATRTVVVVDTLPPILTLLGENPLMLELGAPFADPGATASDQCGGDLNENILFTNTVNPNLAGAYTNTFAVTDASGNTAVTNRIVVVVIRPVLTGLAQTADGAFHFTFASTPGACFNVVTTTNLSLPATEWTVLGPATESPAGQFQFTDTAVTNQSQHFYRLRWP